MVNNMADEDDDVDVDVVGDLGTEFHPIIAGSSIEDYSELTTNSGQNLWNLQDLEINVKVLANNVSNEDREIEITKKKMEPPPVNKSPWTEDERQIFLKGMADHGRKWSKIAKMLPTRSTIQVRNFARQYYRKITDEREAASIKTSNEDGTTMVLSGFNPVGNVDPFQVTESEVVRLQKCDSEENSEGDVDVDDDGITDDNKTEIMNVKDGISEETNLMDPKNCGCSETLEISSTTTQDIDCNLRLLSPIDDNSLLNNLFNSDNLNLEEHEASYLNSVNDLLEPSHMTNIDDDKLLDSGEQVLEGSDGQDDEKHDVSFEPPKFELKLPRDLVTEQEKHVHFDFFEDRPSKTPARYLKIRNHILDMWEKWKPVYLNKTSVRTGLKNCGDVNCIGRIHAYLEAIGAINFGCEQVSYQPISSFLPSKVPREKKKFKPQTWLRENEKRDRKRKLIDIYGTSQGGGYTIEHRSNGEDIILQKVEDDQKGVNQIVRKPRNPFKLIPYSEFGAGQQAPYEVAIHLEATITMDVHAHCSRTEIIGLLGGKFTPSDEMLHILIAEPCKSISTDMQCEMDPVSQTEASECIQQQGLQVVGWYHSHPTFPPNPSLRDLETQTKYQEWFHQRKHPFLGIIITPYTINTTSQLRCMVVGDETFLNDYKKPFCLRCHEVGERFQTETAMKQLRKAVQSLTKDGSAISLDTAYKPHPGYTYLDKLMKSLESHANKSDVSLSVEFCDALKALLMDHTNGSMYR